MLRGWIHEVDAPGEKLEDGEIGVIGLPINRGRIRSERWSSLQAQVPDMVLLIEVLGPFRAEAYRTQAATLTVRYCGG